MLMLATASAIHVRFASDLQMVDSWCFPPGALHAWNECMPWLWHLRCKLHNSVQIILLHFTVLSECFRIFAAMFVVHIEKFVTYRYSLGSVMGTINYIQKLKVIPNSVLIPWLWLRKLTLNPCRCPCMYTTKLYWTNVNLCSWRLEIDLWPSLARGGCTFVHQVKLWWPKMLLIHPRPNQSDVLAELIYPVCLMYVYESIGQLWCPCTSFASCTSYVFTSQEPLPSLWPL